MTTFLPDGSFDDPLASIDWTKLGLTLPTPDVSGPNTADWSSWWDNLLWGDRTDRRLFYSPEEIGQNFKTSVGQISTDTGNALSQGVGAVGQSINSAVNDAVNKSTSAALPYLALGGLGLAAILLLQRPAR